MKHLTSNIDHFFQSNNYSISFLEKIQITHLDIHTNDDEEDKNDINEIDRLEMFVPLSKCLIDRTIHQRTLLTNVNPSISRYSSIKFSSLTKLNIQLNTFEDCLFLSDDRFPSLSHSSIFVDKIFSTSSSSPVVNRVSFFSQFSSRIFLHLNRSIYLR